MIASSYLENNYGEVFKAIVDSFKPANCVELGVLNGYSAFWIATALKKNGRGVLNIYDLFEDYEFNHSKMDDIVHFFSHCPMVNVHRKNAYEVHEGYPDRSVDLLHVDLSNTGDTVKLIMELWNEKMVYGGIILFEGGTEERDNIPWMIKYSKPAIKPEIENNPIITKHYIYGTYLKFPGLTMLLKKW